MFVCGSADPPPEPDVADLVCAVCLSVPPGMIHQCRRGHHFCAECLARCGRACPTCRTTLPVPPIRCLVAEKWADATRRARPAGRAPLSRRVERLSLTDYGTTPIADLVHRWIPAAVARSIAGSPADGDVARAAVDSDSDEVALEVETFRYAAGERVQARIRPGRPPISHAVWYDGTIASRSHHLLARGAPSYVVNCVFGPYALRSHLVAEFDIRPHYDPYELLPTETETAPPPRPPTPGPGPAPAPSWPPPRG